MERIKAVGINKGTGHVLESGMVMTERVKCGGIAEEVEVKVAERGVVTEPSLHKVDEFIRRKAGGVLFEMGFEEGSELDDLSLSGGGGRS